MNNQEYSLLSIQNVRVNVLTKANLGYLFRNQQSSLYLEIRWDFQWKEAMSNEITRLVARDGSYFTCFLFNPFLSALAFEKQETELNPQAVSYINGEIFLSCFSHHFELFLEANSEVDPD